MRYTDDRPNASLLGQRGVSYIDCGVSGGIWGKDNGYGLDPRCPWILIGQLTHRGPSVSQHDVQPMSEDVTPVVEPLQLALVCHDAEQVVRSSEG